MLAVGKDRGGLLAAALDEGADEHVSILEVRGYCYGRFEVGLLVLQRVGEGSVVVWFAARDFA